MSKRSFAAFAVPVKLSRRYDIMADAKGVQIDSVGFYASPGLQLGPEAVRFLAAYLQRWLSVWDRDAGA